MTYEDMTLTQLKALAKDRNLGTGRSKKDLIEKLEADDTRIKNLAEEVDSLTENQVDQLIEEGEPVDIEPAPKTEVAPPAEISNPTVFRISFSHFGGLLESEHKLFQGRTLDYAKSEGLIPKGGPEEVRLVKSEGSRLIYEIEIQP